ncbi:MAG TPA: ergothioneine biosynthesis protein EgtC [Polyangiaceae bacterium]|nr:ergothioneine biosynthesis protein EgtC [Polyangiaceae bacterium]
MCRIAAYLGPPIALSDLLFDAERSLADVAREPRELPKGALGADGHGVAWYAEGRAEAARYRSVLPLWADQNLRSFAPAVRSGCVVASVRSATQGIAVDFANTPPFVEGAVSLVHNGELEDFRASWRRPLRASLSAEREAGVEGGTDTELVFAVFLDELAGRAPSAEALEGALRRAIARVGERAAAASKSAGLNLIVSGGRSLVASRVAFGREAPSLYVARDGARGGGWVASEPLSTAGPWQRVPERSLVAFDGAGAAPRFAAL